MTKPNAIEEIMATAICRGWPYKPDFSDSLEAVRECLAAIDAAGLAVVPREATEEMGQAAALGSSQYALDEALALWPFMLDAFDPTTWKPKP